MASNPEDVIADIVQQMRTRAMVAGQASLEERDDALREAQEHEAYFLTTACDALEAEVARLTAAQATPPASPEPPPDDLVALVRALQAHAKEADWQDVDDPIQALLAWEPAASPVPVAPQETKEE